MKDYAYSQEIDATKSILFKTHMKRLTETLLRQNEAEKVLLTAMSDLIEEMPDVSVEDLDDINRIDYKNHQQTSNICNQAMIKLKSLSREEIDMEIFDDSYLETSVEDFQNSSINDLPPTYSDSENLHHAKSKKDLIIPTAPSFH